METQKTILVVDDLEATRYAICRILRNANYKTVEAASGRSAIQEASQARPDAIILDMNLPDQSGMVTLRQLRSTPETSSIPVLFLSAETQSAFARTQAEIAGATGYLFSPVEPDTLLQVLKGIIERGVS